MLLGELGKLPLSEVIRYRVLNFWFRIVTCKNDRKLCKILYDIMFEMNNQNVGPVSQRIIYVKSSLDQLGLSFIWLTQGILTVEHSNWFKCLVKQRIKDQYISIWQSKVMDSSSCVIYRMYKSSFDNEIYLKNSLLLLL